MSNETYKASGFFSHRVKPGTEFKKTGEFRAPKDGEWFEYQGEADRANFDFNTECWILRESE